jgi:NAD(P)-dependent dehydrogenase (short-subunit alcohol dehydrogenase family)
MAGRLYIPREQGEFVSQPKNVLITGSNSGFGDLISRTLIRNGYTVFATMRDPEGRNLPRSQELQAFAEASSGKVHVLDLDVTSEASVAAAFRRAIELEGTIDVVINNAGIGSGGFGEAFTADQWQRLFDVNVFGVQRVLRAALPPMRERGSGLVIHISSIMGRIVIPFSAPYTASKYALEGLAETYRYELMGTGVETTIVQPGGFPTNFGDRLVSPADEDRVNSYGELKEIPEKLWGGMFETLRSKEAPDPQEVADAVLELIESPAGERPLRVVVDPMMGGEAPEAINKLTGEIQQQLLSNLGLGGKLTPAAG